MKNILVHTCCGPCAIMPLQKLMQDNFTPTAYFFNPNIHLQKEYLLRLYAMHAVTKHYKIPLIIQGNHQYFQNLTNFKSKVTHAHHEALSACVPFLYKYGQKNTNAITINDAHADSFKRNYPDKSTTIRNNSNHTNKQVHQASHEPINKQVWTQALEKIHTKWENYASEFPLFNKATQENLTITPLSSAEELIINAPLFIARLLDINQNKIDTPYAHNNYLIKNSIFTEGERCKKCYEERLYQTALYASQNNFDTFTTTLLYSCYQNHDDICNAAYTAQNRVNLENTKSVTFHYQDFRTLWQDGIDMSKELGLYRQKWCGCNLSRLESLERMTKREYDKKMKNSNTK